MLFNRCSSSFRTHAETILNIQQAAIPQKMLATITTIIAVVALVLAAIGIVGILHAHGLITQLPSSLQWIASEGVIGHSLMLGGAGGLACLAIYMGSRCHNTQVKQSAAGSVQPQLVTPKVVTQAPPITEILSQGLQNPSLVTINPNAGKSFPPTAQYPFPTVEFTLTVQNNDGKWEYKLPCMEFCTKQQKATISVVGTFIVDGQALEIQLDRQDGQDHRLTDEEVIESDMPKADKLNAKINENLNGYLSKVDADRLTAELQQGIVARWFLTYEEPTQIKFYIPGLISTHVQDKTLMIVRDPTVLLAPQDQIDLLKRSSVPSYKNAAEQLENPQWTYTANFPIASFQQSDDVVFLNYAWS